MSWIYPRKSQSKQILPKNRLWKFAAVGCFLIELDISTNKSSAANFAGKSVADICCDWLFANVNVLSRTFQKINTAKGGSIAPKILRRVSFPKSYRTAALSLNEDSEVRFDSTEYSEGCRCRTCGAIEQLRFQKMKTAKRGSIAPHFPKGVVSENLVLSNRCAFGKRAVRWHQGFRV